MVTQAPVAFVNFVKRLVTDNIEPIAEHFDEQYGLHIKLMRDGTLEIVKGDETKTFRRLRDGRWKSSDGEIYQLNRHGQPVQVMNKKDLQRIKRGQDPLPGETRPEGRRAITADDFGRAHSTLSAENPHLQEVENSEPPLTKLESGELADRQQEQINEITAAHNQHMEDFRELTNQCAERQKEVIAIQNPIDGLRESADSLKSDIKGLKTTFRKEMSPSSMPSQEIAEKLEQNEIGPELDEHWNHVLVHEGDVKQHTRDLRKLEHDRRQLDKDLKEHAQKITDLESKQRRLSQQMLGTPGTEYHFERIKAEQGELSPKLEHQYSAFQNDRTALRQEQRDLNLGKLGLQVDRETLAARQESLSRELKRVTQQEKELREYHDTELAADQKAGNEENLRGRLDAQIKAQEEQEKELERQAAKRKQQEERQRELEHARQAAEREQPDSGQDSVTPQRRDDLVLMASEGLPSAEREPRRWWWRRADRETTSVDTEAAINDHRAPGTQHDVTETPQESRRETSGGEQHDDSAPHHDESTSSEQHERPRTSTTDNEPENTRNTNDHNTDPPDPHRPNNNTSPTAQNGKKLAIAGVGVALVGGGVALAAHHGQSDAATASGSDNESSSNSGSSNTNSSSGDSRSSGGASGNNGSSGSGSGSAYSGSGNGIAGGGSKGGTGLSPVLGASSPSDSPQNLAIGVAPMPAADVSSQGQDSGSSGASDTSTPTEGSQSASGQQSTPGTTDPTLLASRTIAPNISEPLDPATPGSGSNPLSALVGLGLPLALVGAEIAEEVSEGTDSDDSHHHRHTSHSSPGNTPATTTTSQSATSAPAAPAPNPPAPPTNQPPPSGPQQGQTAPSTDPPLPPNQDHPPTDQPPSDQPVASSTSPGQTPWTQLL